MNPYRSVTSMVQWDGARWTVTRLAISLEARDLSQRVDGHYELTFHFFSAHPKYTAEIPAYLAERLVARGDARGTICLPAVLDSVRATLALQREYKALEGIAADVVRSFQDVLGIPREMPSGDPPRSGWADHANAGMAMDDRNPPT